MTKLGIEGTAAVILMIPCHRVIITHLSAFITLFIDLHQDLYIFIKVFEIIPFIKPFPYIRQMFGRGMSLVNNIQFCILLLWMTFKIGTNKFCIPYPIVFRIRCRMNTNKTTACLYKSFKSSFLFMIEDITRCIEEDNCSVFF